jgi:hypothetical protein
LKSSLVEAAVARQITKQQSESSAVFFIFLYHKAYKIVDKSINIHMADFNNSTNKAFTDALYGQREGVGSAANPLTALGTPVPLNNTDRSDGRGGFFSLSASNNSMELLSSSNHHTFANDPVIGLLYNNFPTASGSHLRKHHLVDPETGGGAAGVNKHAAATILFAGNYVNGANHAKHNKIALVTKNGNIITYTMNKHETVNHKHSFTPTGSGGSNFKDSKNTLGLNGTSAGTGDNMRRLVQLGYR